MRRLWICSLLLLSGSLLFAAERGWNPKWIGWEPRSYTPRLLNSIEDATGKLQVMAPHISCMSGAPAQQITINSYGMKVDCSRSGVSTQARYFWSWDGGYAAPVQTPYKIDETKSVLYSNVSSFVLFQAHGKPLNYAGKFGVPFKGGTWAIGVVSNDTRFAWFDWYGPNMVYKGDGFFVTDSEANAQMITDAIATLVAASGKKIVADPGVVISCKDCKKNTFSEPQRVSNVSGVEVGLLARGGPADVAGIQPGDVITEVGGIPTTSVDEFMTRVREQAEKASDRKLRLKIFRQRSYLEKELQLDDVNAGSERLVAEAATLLKKSAPRGTREESTTKLPPVRLGIDARPVTAAEAQQLRLPSDSGIYVLGLEAGSLAETMRMQKGDVIFEMTGTKIKDLQQFRTLLNEGAISTITVWRNGSALALTVPQKL